MNIGTVIAVGVIFVAGILISIVYLKQESKTSLSSEMIEIEKTTNPNYWKNYMSEESADVEEYEFFLKYNSKYKEHKHE